MFYDPDWKKTIIESHRFWTKFLWKRNQSIWEPEVIKKTLFDLLICFELKTKRSDPGSCTIRAKFALQTTLQTCELLHVDISDFKVNSVFFLVLIRPTFFSIWSSHSHWQQCLSASDSIAVTFTIDLWTSGNMKKNYSYEE